MAVFNNPLRVFHVMDKVAEIIYQSTTLKEMGTTITAMYISLKATQEDKQTILHRSAKMSRGQSVIVGDLNVRNRTWDTTENRRGIRKKPWDRENGWIINAPNEPTCATTRGASTPDIIMTKGIRYSNPTVIIPAIKISVTTNRSR